MFSFFKACEAEQYAFYRIPKELIINPMFKKLSTDAKLLYGLMLDRMGLSLKNGWVDENNNIYIYFTLDDIREHLQCGAEKAVHLLAELDGKKGIGLIARKKQGQGKPTRIFVKNFIIREDMQTSDNQKSEDGQTSDNQNPAITETGSRDFGKSNCNKTEYIKTDFSKTDILSIPSAGEPAERHPAPDTVMDGGMEPPGKQHGKILSMAEIEQLEREVAEQVYVSDFLEARNEQGGLSYKPGLVRAVFSVMVELLMHTGDSIFIDGGYINADWVKLKVRAMGHWDFEYVLKGLQNNTTPVKNMKAYIRTAVYRAAAMNEAHYDLDENGGYYDGSMPEDVDVAGIIELGRRIREKFGGQQDTLEDRGS